MKALLQYPNVVGFGTGFKYAKGERTDQICTTVLVTKKLPQVALRPEYIVPAKIRHYQTDVIEVGIIRALQARTDRWRPAPPGVSIGHYLITAGTFGCVVKKDGQRFILSNNHVLANQNDALVGDPIYQPGAHDGGDEAIAVLEDFVPIEFDDGSPTCSIAQAIAKHANLHAKIWGSTHRLKAYREIQVAENLVDAAIARPLGDDLIVDEILEIGMLTGIAGVMLGESVRKSGRTTGLTSGTVTVLNATVRVEYTDAAATLTDQIISTGMSQPGDSGSVLVDDDNRAVGLLFAGSDQVTIHNTIFNVLGLLGIEI